MTRLICPIWLHVLLAWPAVVACSDVKLHFLLRFLVPTWSPCPEGFMHSAPRDQWFQNHDDLVEHTEYTYTGGKNN